MAGVYHHAADHATVATLDLDDFGHMPARWFGYEGVEAVILATSRPEVYRPLKPDSPQIAALAEWVEMGGTLVLGVGRSAGELLSEGGPLRPLAPGKFQQLVPLRQASTLESYSASTASISPLVGPRQELRAPRLIDVQGAVEAREGKDLPLVIRRVSGFGQVVFAAVDLDLPPMSQWAGRPLLVRRLLDLSPSQAAEAPRSAAVMHFGFDDVAGQLRRRWTSSTGCRRFRFGWSSRSSSATWR